jgi:hypothetical protein
LFFEPFSANNLIIVDFFDFVLLMESDNDDGLSGEPDVSLQADFFRDGVLFIISNILYLL